MEYDRYEEFVDLLLIQLGLFVCVVTFSGLAFTVWHFQRQIAVVTCGKKVSAANMVVVSDLVIGCCKIVTALLTNGRSVIVCLLCIRQWRHVLVIGQY